MGKKRIKEAGDEDAWGKGVWVMGLLEEHSVTNVSAFLWKLSIIRGTRWHLGKSGSLFSSASSAGPCTEWTWQQGPTWLHVGLTHRLPQCSLIWLSPLLSACLPRSRDECWALPLDMEGRKPVNHLVESDYIRALLSHWEQRFLPGIDRHAQICQLCL